MAKFVVFSMAGTLAGVAAGLVFRLNGASLGFSVFGSLLAFYGIWLVALLYVVISDALISRQPTPSIGKP